MHLSDVPFVVVDVETTGGSADTDRVIELAAVKMRGREVVDEFAQLVNPERSVPRRITRMTGITTAMLFEKPPMAEVLPGFMEVLGDGVVVAHNIPFDKRFLDAERRRLDQSPLPHDTLCTLRLARRLLRDLSSKGLSHLIDHYDLQIESRHRALGDARAAAQILLRFLQRLRYEHDLETLQEVLAFQHSTYSTSKATPSHLRRIRRTVKEEAPRCPGVYFMKDAKGTPLYVGKAKNLRKRIGSYFSGLGAKPARTRKLVTTLREVDWEETGSELEALLRESKLIKKRKPRFNRAQRRYRNRPFLRLDTSEAFPRLSTTAYLRDDGAEYYGPLRRRAADFIVEVIDRAFKLRPCSDEQLEEGRRCLYAEMDRCLAPCEEADAACYEVEVERVRRFLRGEDDAVLAYLKAKMERAAEQLDFETASYYRDGLKTLHRLLARQRQVGASVLEHNAAIVRPKSDGTARLFLVRFGRLAEAFSVSCRPPADEQAEMQRRLREQFDASQERPERYFKEEVEEVRLLVQWMYEHREDIEEVRWQPGETAASLMERILTVLDRASPNAA